VIWSSRGLPRLGRRRNAENAFAFEYDLVADSTLATQLSTAVLLGQLDHLHTDVNDVADFDGTEKA
jgi:hypothetical protein